VYKARERTNDNPPVCLDVIRCRRNALYFNAHKVPVFSVMDSVEVSNGANLQTADVYFVTKKYKAFELQLGYTGEGWYARVAAEWWLHTGVITPQDISHVLRATAHLPHDVFRTPLDEMRTAWQDAHMDKQAVNSLIGLWFLDEAVSYRHFSSSDVRDAPAGDWRQSVFVHPGGQEYDWVKVESLVNTTSYRPILDLVLSTECTRVGQAIYALKRQGLGRHILEYKTDSILVTPPARRKRKVEALWGLTYDDLSGLRDRFEGKARRLNEYCPLTQNTGTNRVFRFWDAEERDWMKTNPDLPRRKGVLEWTALRWTDLNEAEAEQRAVNGGSLLVEGPPGSGKSHLCKRIAEQLKAAGKKVAVISKTHVASSRVGGVTADHFVKRYILHGVCNYDVVWVEEFGQIDVALWCELNKLKQVQWLLSGDPDQFEPIGNNFRGSRVSQEALMRSDFLHGLAGNRLRLTECRRSSALLYEAYMWVSAHKCRPIAELVEHCRNIFPAKPGFAEINLTLSHKRRMWLNKRINETVKPKDAIFVRKVSTPGATMASQSMWIYPGQILLACVGIHKALRNGVSYQVLSASKEEVQLEGGIRLCISDAARLLRLSHARTISSCQGDEFPSVRIWDTSHRRFTWRHLYVAMSRGQTAELA
jgi:hypothetical protein